MPKPSTQTPTTAPGPWRRHLRSFVKDSIRLETKVSSGQQVKPIQKVAYGTIVRVRRLAEVVGQIGPERAYESRILVRSMLELYFNYAWMRLRSPQRRANRFLKFLALEHLKIQLELTRTPDLNLPPLRQAIKTSTAERTKLRHLFRITDAKGKRRWAKDWARGASVETRIGEVLGQTMPDQQFDPFLYTLYRIFSSAVHGGPQSFLDCLTSTQFGFREAPQPETNPAAPYVAACVILLGTHTAASKDLSYTTPQKARLAAISTRFKARAPAFSNTLGVSIP